MMDVSTYKRILPDYPITSKRRTPKICILIQWSAYSDSALSFTLHNAVSDSTLSMQRFWEVFLTLHAVSCPSQFDKGGLRGLWPVGVGGCWGVTVRLKATAIPSWKHQLP